ncbi:MAG: polysaccharide pyruvyl transferase family protein [Acetivibrio ethanolgignens]
MYQSVWDEIDENCLGLSVGGDNYCYSGWQRWRDIHGAFFEMGVPDVLWSCSIDRKCIEEEMIKTFKSYALITAREEVTYQTLVKAGLDNVVRCADVAFLMEPEEIQLPTSFQKKNTVALNISPLLIRREKKEGIVLNAIIKTLDFILEETDMQILLLPHVTMPTDNDEQALEEIYKKYRDDRHKRKRFCFCPSAANAAQRKYLISKCRFLITARSHAAIAAYSTGVPSLALGYSDKAKGIAMDFGMDAFVLAVDDLAENQIIEKLWLLMQQETALKKQLIENRKKTQLLAKKNFDVLESVIKERK